MKIRVLFIFVSILIGILFVFNFLNNKTIYAKQSYHVYALQAGAYKDYDNALKSSNNLPPNIIIKEDNLYKIYVGIYKSMDLVNKMLAYFEDENIYIYLKQLNVNKNFYNNLETYEAYLNNSNNELLYNNINKSILDLYLESEK